MDSVMKTAEEILDKHNLEYAAGGLIYLHEAEEAMKEYARLKCKEQRELCAKSVGFIASQDQARNAPEPEFS